VNTAIFPHTYCYKDEKDTSLGETSMAGKFCSSFSDIITFQLSPIFQSLLIFVGGLPLMCVKCYTTLFVLLFHNRPWR